MKVLFTTALCAVAGATLAGCVAIPADGGRAEVDRWVAARNPAAGPGIQQRVAEQVDAALRKPLDAGASVRIAMLQSPRLRGSYARLGVASAELYEAGRLSNPRLSAALLDSSVGGEQLTLGLVQRLVDLVLLPRRAKLGAQQFAQLKQDLAHEILVFAADVERSHYRLAAAQQSATLRALVARTAATSARVAERFHAAGNITALALAQERAAASQARLEALSMQAQLDEARSAHARLLGLAPETDWTLEAQLPTPLAEDDPLDTLVALARESRLDLAAARGRVELHAGELGMSGSRWIDSIEIGVEREREADGERLTGPTLSVDLPLFNTRNGVVLRARGELERSSAELAELSLDIAHEVRLTHARTVAARTRAQEFRSALIPAREAIVARTQEAQSFMLVDQFVLLAAKADEYDAYQGYVESVRDYWLARVDLTAAVGTQLPGTPPADRAPPPIEVPQPPAAPGEPGEKPHAEHEREHEHERQRERENQHEHHSPKTGAP